MTDHARDQPPGILNALKRFLRRGGRADERRPQAGGTTRPDEPADEGGRAGAEGDVATITQAPKRELYERARELGIEGRSNMSKDELAAAIVRANR